jgi:uncharacterized protein (DUF302 family)
VTVEVQRTFDDAKRALEKAAPALDLHFLSHLQSGDFQKTQQALERLPALSIFSSRDHGGLLAFVGKSRRAIQYEIGNPLTASLMTRHVLSAALYAPLRVLLREAADGQVAFEYDQPSTLFGQFGNEEVTEVGLGLDASLSKLIQSVADSAE